LSVAIGGVAARKQLENQRVRSYSFLPESTVKGASSAPDSVLTIDYSAASITHPRAEKGRMIPKLAILAAESPYAVTNIKNLSRSHDKLMKVGE
jgi:hypothetical protein